MGKQHNRQQPTRDTSAMSASKLLQTRPFQAETQALERQKSQAAAEFESLSKGFDLTQPGALAVGESSPPALGQPLQAKLTIGEPNDKYEQEADRVAKNVVQRIHAPQSDPVQPDEAIQRHADHGEDELQMKPLLRRQASMGGGDASSELESSINQAKGSGQALDPSLQQSMGQSMGADFSGVKVHTDAQADELNRSIQAKAFTTGTDVFFKKGEYNPGSRSGQELIAHELTHVVQQRGTSIQHSDTLQQKSAEPIPVREQAIKEVAQRAVNPKSQQERQAFLDTYSLAATLVSGIDINGTDTQILDGLVANFNSSGFVYTMRYKLPDTFLNGTKQGDCATLSGAFVKIAKEYFGITGIGTDKYDGDFGVPNGGAVIDRTPGNVDNGTHWAFISHTWVTGPDRDRDILFRGNTLDRSNWIYSTGSGTTDDGFEYREFTGLGGGRVYEYKALAQDLRERYTTDIDEARQGKAEMDEYIESLKPKKKKGCFITTACIEAKNLPDHCEELTVLRNFRDEYMHSIENGSKMIEEYYKIAPEIVNHISLLPNSQQIFADLYDQVLKSVNLVKAGQNKAAMQNYISIIRSLKKQYL